MQRDRHTFASKTDRNVIKSSTFKWYSFVNTSYSNSVYWLGFRVLGPNPSRPTIFLFFHNIKTSAVVHPVYAMVPKWNRNSEQMTMVMNAWSYASNPFRVLYWIQHSQFYSFCVYKHSAPVSCTINPPTSILYHHVRVQKAYQLFMYWGCLCFDVGTGA
jgi:hypothetical protein